MMSIESGFYYHYSGIKLILDFDRIEKQNAKIHGMVWRYGINDNISMVVY
jgi:hypothetical protein